jgi:hypothetical protein
MEWGMGNGEWGILFSKVLIFYYIYYNKVYNKVYIVV